MTFKSDVEDEIGILEDEIEIQFRPGGRNHFGPGTQSLRTWDETTSDLEDEIEP